jgi:uncharacterized protein (TIGR02145 family)
MYNIPSPPAGLIVYNATLNTICWFNGSTWETLTNRDGQGCGVVTYGGLTYNTVIIGMQCWMKSNLNIGLAILHSLDQTDNGTIEKYCNGDNTANCDEYGGLYQWAEMVQYQNGASNTTSWNPAPTGNVQGICPPGWHLPENSDWSTLTTYLDGTTVAGGKLKETGLTHWNTPNTGATNSSGFTALPGGWYNSSGMAGTGFYGNFSSASEYSSTQFWYRGLTFDDASVNVYHLSKRTSFSVRCLKD